MATNVQTPKKASFEKWRKFFDAANGELEHNAVFKKMFDKIANQFVMDTFDYELTILNTYLKQTNMIGGIDELVSLGLGHREDYDPNVDWTKDQFIPDTYVVWAPITFEDRYFYTQFYDQMARAFVNETAFQSVLGMMQKSLLDKKTMVWYDRIISLLKSYKTIVEVDPNDEKTFGPIITETMMQFSLPSGKWNEAEKPNATRLDKQHIVWNAKYKNRFTWLNATLYNNSSITSIGKALEAEFVDFNDDDIVAVLDTPNKIYIAPKYQAPAEQPMGAVKKINFYLHETYTVAVCPWENGVIFKKKGTSEEK